MNEKNVYIIGYNLTEFGEHYNQDSVSLAATSLKETIRDTKINQKDIQSFIFGSFLSGSYSQQAVETTCINACNLTSSVTGIKTGNASGAAAFHQAFLNIRNGLLDCVAVIGVEKLSDYILPGQIETILGSTIDYQWEFEMGATVTSLYALMTKAHMREYKTTLEQLAFVPFKNHKNGVNNEKAQFKREISLERFLNAKKICDPIGKFDPATNCDGAASVLLASEKFLKENPEIEVKVPILSSVQACDKTALHHRDEITTLKATKYAARKAYELAKISANQINVAEVHDSYPIGEILAIEDLGFFKKGEGGKATEEGRTELNNEISINSSGGLKARGDPFGATGIAQIIEITQQLTGKAKNRQIKDCDFGLTQNIVGTGTIAYVNILAREGVNK